MRRSTGQLAPVALRKRRSAFTLVEIMIVIVVIAILMALLLPAVQSVFRTARNSNVQMEIKSIEQAIAAFKVQYGIDPPSSITLMELPSQMTSADQAVIRRLWGRFDFANNKFDWNGNNTPGEMNVGVTLRGAECLVFFLGGIRGVDPMTLSPINNLTGFSKNPANPFTVQKPNGETREGPFYDFKVSRLVASNNQSNFLVYIDPLSGHSAPYAPYFYISSNDGRGYIADDLINGPVMSGASRLLKPYTMTASGNFWNPKTYQIISPGADHLYGNGGQYNEDMPNSGLDPAVRADNDNLTNFHSGPLK
jgi:prepilin-type N-terminal cleavage/methylation domain-containing protein